jgi:hypothetical protein
MRQFLLRLVIYIIIAIGLSMIFGSGLKTAATGSFGAQLGYYIGYYGFYFGFWILLCEGIYRLFHRLQGKANSNLDIFASESTAIEFFTSGRLLVFRAPQSTDIARNALKRAALDLAVADWIADHYKSQSRKAGP